MPNPVLIGLRVFSRRTPENRSSPESLHCLHATFIALPRCTWLTVANMAVTADSSRHSRKFRSHNFNNSVEVAERQRYVVFVAVAIIQQTNGNRLAQTPQSLYKWHITESTIRHYIAADKNHLSGCQKLIKTITVDTYISNNISYVISIIYRHNQPQGDSMALCNTMRQFLRRFIINSSNDDRFTLCFDFIRAISAPWFVKPTATHSKRIKVGKFPHPLGPPPQNLRFSRNVATLWVCDETTVSHWSTVSIILLA